MKKATTPAQHEQYLNELYADNYSESQAMDSFVYLANKSRGKHTTEAAIRNAYHNHTLGTLLRKYDPVAFNVSKSDN